MLQLKSVGIARGDNFQFSEYVTQRNILFFFNVISLFG